MSLSSSKLIQRLLRNGGGQSRNDIFFTRLLSSSSPASSSSSSKPSTATTRTTTPTKFGKKEQKETFLENLIRESNASFPNLEGKVVSGIVTKIDSRNGFIDVDVGFKMPSSFVKEELPEHVKLGDRVPLRVKRYKTRSGRWTWTRSRSISLENTNWRGMRLRGKERIESLSPGES